MLWNKHVLFSKGKLLKQQRSVLLCQDFWNKNLCVYKLKWACLKQEGELRSKKKDLYKMRKTVCRVDMNCRPLVVCQFWVLVIQRSFLYLWVFFWLLMYRYLKKKWLCGSLCEISFHLPTTLGAHCRLCNALLRLLMT